MYNCYEIRIIFARCTSITEVLQAAAAFESIIQDGGLQKQEERFSRMEAVVRTRQIRSINR